jgi:hypothetical protein
MPKVANPSRNLPTLCPGLGQGCQAVPPPCQHLPKVARTLPALTQGLPSPSMNLPTLCPGLGQGCQAAPPPCQHSPKFARPCHQAANTCPHFPSSGAWAYCVGTSGRSRGRDRIGATWAESQWIVAARPLCHLQYPVAYLSRLQRILPAARWEFLQGVPCDSSAARVSPTTRAFGGRGPYCWSANGRRAHASLLARILT